MDQLLHLPPQAVAMMPHGKATDFAMTKTTMQDAISMEETVVETTSIKSIVKLAHVWILLF